MTLSHCLEKQARLKELFSSCSTQEEKYLKIIELGRSLPLLAEKWRTEDTLTTGCQSLLYLKTEKKEGVLTFSTYSNALISLGLAALLIAIYERESPEVVIKCAPTVLKEIGIGVLLSPGRINGLSSLYTRMRRDALLLI